MWWKWCFGPFFFLSFLSNTGFNWMLWQGQFFFSGGGAGVKRSEVTGWMVSMLEYLWVKKLPMHCPWCVAKRSREKNLLLLLMNIVIVIIWLLSHDRDRTDAINSANNLHVWRVRPMAYWVQFFWVREKSSLNLPFNPNGSTGIRCSQSDSRHTYSYKKKK